MHYGIKMKKRKERNVNGKEIKRERETWKLLIDRKKTKEIKKQKRKTLEKNKEKDLSFEKEK